MATGDDATERLALRATLTASHLLGLATGTHLRTLRGHPDPLLDLQARLEEAELKARAHPGAASGPVASRTQELFERLVLFQNELHEQLAAGGAFLKTGLYDVYRIPVQ